MLSTDYNRKWKSLFQDWEYDVFGGVHNQLDHKQIWNKFAVFLTNSKRREKLKSDSSSHAAAVVQARDHQIVYNNLNNLSYSDAVMDKSERISMKSNTLSVTSQYTKHNANYLIPSKINEFIKEANEFNANIAGTLTQQNINTTNERLYDNLRNDQTSLSELFSNRKDELLEGVSNESDVMVEDKNHRNSKKRSLDFIPTFAIANLSKYDLCELRRYLKDSFKDLNHPFGLLNNSVSHCFYTSYGCWKVKTTSILSHQAMQEWECLSKRIYGIVRRMFPALPIEAEYIDG